MGSGPGQSNNEKQCWEKMLFVLKLKMNKYRKHKAWWKGISYLYYLFYFILRACNSAPSSRWHPPQPLILPMPITGPDNPTPSGYVCPCLLKFLQVDLSISSTWAQRALSYNCVIFLPSHSLSPWICTQSEDGLLQSSKPMTAADFSLN